MPRASHGTAASGNGNGDRQQTQQETGKVRGMTDRDTFAAAALTGLLANSKNNDTTADTIRFWAWNWADAMLRERERTNHDAAPAARARTDADRDRTDNAGIRPGLGTGDTQEPVAWGVAHGGGVIASSISRIDAVDMQSDYAFDTEVVPLYRSPTLTATPPLHATHGECSLPPECTQPVAWWVTLPGRDFPYLSHIKDRAIFCHEEEPGSEVISLYCQPQPTLTDEEREAIADAAGRYVEGITPKAQEYAATLRGLLERMK
jgi:hypothetical protein